MLDSAAYESEIRHDREYPESAEYQIQFSNGRRNPGMFKSPTAAREYADAMPWFSGYDVVKVK